MNDDVIIVVFVFNLLFFIILREKLSRLKQQYNDLEYHIQLIELDDYMERLFQTDEQRLDLLLNKKIGKIIDEKMKLE